MIEFCVYKENDAPAWNTFLATSKNGTFLFDRGFMDYHSDRFDDFSLMIFNEKKLVALFPANLSEDNILHSHAGLTYGGLVTGVNMTAALALIIFDELIKYLRENKIIQLHYKPIPHIYHRHPSEEDLHALFLVGARLNRSDISSAIQLGSSPKFSKSKKRGVNKAKKADLIISKSDEWARYWQVLAANLCRHNTKPTHSLAELRLLKCRFPNHIFLFAAHKQDDLLAGLVVFDCGSTIHIQYIASTEQGRNLGAVDAIVSHLVSLYDQRDWLDFGISTTDQGRSLNVGLSRQKEMYGARTIVYQHYLLNL